MLETFKILQIISAILTITAVLMHSPKGEGIGSIGSSAQMFSFSSKTERFLNIFSFTVGGLFLLTSALLGWKIVH